MLVIESNRMYVGKGKIEERCIVGIFDDLFDILCRRLPTSKFLT